MDPHVTIGAGLPPIPPKLVAKIESGEFMDMAELLPDRWGAAKSLAGDKSLRAPKSRRRTCSYHNSRMGTVLQHLPYSHR